tara:strand:+ start:187 stop:441 length:255 start_codon:yes stop_codon:yes gene_type:complete
MKLTKSQLKRIIKEELGSTVQEAHESDPAYGAYTQAIEQLESAAATLEALPIHGEPAAPPGPLVDAINRVMAAAEVSINDLRGR